MRALGGVRGVRVLLRWCAVVVWGVGLGLSLDEDVAKMNLGGDNVAA